jgi:hypothetical protein
MTRQIVWKEAREQGAVLLALVGLGAGLMAATAILGGTTGAAEGLTFRTVNYTGRVLLVMLVMTAGIVAGGSLFAGEREQGTFTFLDHLPVSRWRVWWRKVLAGAVLAGGASLALLLAAGLAGQLGGTSERVLVGWALAVLVLTAVGFGWGVFGSTRADSSLGACGLGLAGALAAAALAGPVFLLVWAVGRDFLTQVVGFSRGDDGGVFGLTLIWMLVFVPLPLAALLYAAPDRSRRLAEQGIRPVAGAGFNLPLPRRPRVRGRVKPGRLGWLLWRQLRGPVAVHAAVALAVGFLCVPWTDQWPAAFLWPAATLVLGVMIGVASVSDEHRGGAGRFWTERRLPVGSLWWAKAAAGLAVTVGLTVVALLPPVLTAIGRSPQYAPSTLAALFRSGLFATGFPQVAFVLWAAVSGFAFGHLSGLLFPKGIVAGAVGLMLGGTFAAAWGPSFLAGGFHGWMAFVPPAVALVTARRVAWAWAADQIGRRRYLLRLAGGTLAALLTVAAGLGWRAVGEVTTEPDQTAHLKFRDALPTFDETQAGRDIRRALGKWQEVRPDVRDAQPDKPFARSVQVGPLPMGAPPQPAEATTTVRQVEEALAGGWPTDRPDLDRWMDDAFATNWDEPLFALPTKPTGVLEDPNEYTSLGIPLKYIPVLQRLGPAFLGRGLQLQRRGDPTDFVRRFQAWLAACRTARHHTLPVVELIANSLEWNAYRALDRWLEKLDGHPELVQQALDVVRKHHAADVLTPDSALMAEQVVYQNMIDAPGTWLPNLLERIRSSRPWDDVVPVRAGPLAETEANVMAFAWAVPWERERLRRVAAVGNVPEWWYLRDRYVVGVPGLMQGLHRYRAGYLMTNKQKEKRYLAARGAAEVVLQLRLHRLTAGEYPRSLAELPGPLPADPYTGRPFGYRRLAEPGEVTLPAWLLPANPGEQTDPRFDGTRSVPLAAGRAVVWSVGPDERDQDGVSMAAGDGRGGDLIFVVPDPPATSAGRPPER